jgi:hypothetical protein
LIFHRLAETANSIFQRERRQLQQPSASPAAGSGYFGPLSTENALFEGNGAKIASYAQVSLLIARVLRLSTTPSPLAYSTSVLP